MTVLDQYLKQRFAIEDANLQPTSGELFMYQELLYRIYILESLKFLTNSAPLSVKVRELARHYGAIDALLSHLLSERRYRASPDADIQKARETAQLSLSSVVSAFRKGFSAYAPKDEAQYKRDISAAVNTILPAWIQYRDTMLPIHNKNKEKYDEQRNRKESNV